MIGQMCTSGKQLNLSVFGFVRIVLRGYAETKKFKISEITIEVGGWVQVSLGFFWLENRPKIALNQC